MPPQTGPNIDNGPGGPALQPPSGPINYPKVITTSTPIRKNINQSLTNYGNYTQQYPQIYKSPDQKELDIANEYDSQYSTLLGQFDTLSGRLDASSQALLGNIASVYSRRRAQQASANLRYQRGLEALGFKTGTAQYAPQEYEGLIKGAENDALARLQDIDAEEQKATIDANNAKAENDMKLFGEKVDLIGSLKKQKADALKAYHDEVQRQFENELKIKADRRDEERLAIDRMKAEQSVNTLFGNLTTGQKSDMADMIVLGKQISSLEALAKQYGGYIGAGATSSWINRPLAAVTGITRPGAQEIRNSIGQVKGYIAKLRGGTSFTPNEQALLDTYTPTIGDSDSVIASKLKSLNAFVRDKMEATLMVSGVSNPGALIDATGFGTYSGGYSIVAPDGNTYSFPNKESLDNFKKEAGI